MLLKINLSRFQKCCSVVFVMLPFLAIAQDPFADDTNDITPAAPIDDYVFIALAVGVFYAYRFFKTQHISKSKG